MKLEHIEKKVKVIEEEEKFVLELNRNEMEFLWVLSAQMNGAGPMRDFMDKIFEAPELKQFWEGVDWAAEDSDYTELKEKFFTKEPIIYLNNYED